VIRRTRISRLISNGVSANHSGAGKNSAMDGAWKPLSPSEAARMRVVATMDRAHSQVVG